MFDVPEFRERLIEAFTNDRKRATTLAATVNMDKAARRLIEHDVEITMRVLEEWMFEKGSEKVDE